MDGRADRPTDRPFGGQTARQTSVVTADRTSPGAVLLATAVRGPRLPSLAVITTGLTGGRTDKRPPARPSRRAGERLFREGTPRCSRSSRQGQSAGGGRIRER